MDCFWFLSHHMITSLSLSPFSLPSLLAVPRERERDLLFEVAAADSLSLLFLLSRAALRAGFGKGT